MLQWFIHIISELWAHLPLYTTHTHSPLCIHFVRYISSTLLCFCKSLLIHYTIFNRVNKAFVSKFLSKFPAVYDSYTVFNTLLCCFPIFCGVYSCKCSAHFLYYLFMNFYSTLLCCLFKDVISCLSTSLCCLYTLLFIHSGHKLFPAYYSASAHHSAVFTYFHSFTLAINCFQHITLLFSDTLY